jgi:hypothetical protein
METQVEEQRRGAGVGDGEVPGAAGEERGSGGGGHALPVLTAMRLSAETALAALASLIAAWISVTLTHMLVMGPGRGAWQTAPLYGVDYVHRSAVVMYREPDSISRRHRETNGASLLGHFLLLCAFPLAYVQYLGASRRVCRWVTGAVFLAYLTLEIGKVVLGVNAMGGYSAGLGFMFLYAALRVLCPSGSAVPRQALRTMLVITIGNILCMNVPSSRSVRVLD